MNNDMTTTIKFRGFRVDGGGWVEGFYYELMDTINNIRIPVIDKSDRFDIDGDSISLFQIHPESLGMFTGLTDRNGKEIYGAIGDKGGDVVNVDEHYVVGGGKWTEQIANILFEKGSFVLRNKNGFYSVLSESIFYCEIIGNQFEQDNGN